MAQMMPETWKSGRVNTALAGTGSTMPPVAQFILNSIAWCRSKLFAGASGPAPLRLVSRLALGGRKSLSLVEVDGVRFLVGGGADSVTVIVPITLPAAQPECSQREEVLES
jgi:flagellar biogenesis protein FliO